MLVLTREAGQSIIIGTAGETCVVTVLRLIAEKRAVSILVNRASAGDPGKLDSRSAQVPSGGSVRIGKGATLTLVDFRDKKVRIGINAPPESSVHRLEVYEAITRSEKNAEDDDSEGDGGAGAPLPRPKSPRPPSLDVRLDEPRDEDDLEPP